MEQCFRTMKKSSRKKLANHVLVQRERDETTMKKKWSRRKRFGLREVVQRKR